MTIYEKEKIRIVKNGGGGGGGRGLIWGLGFFWKSVID